MKLTTMHVLSLAAAAWCFAMTVLYLDSFSFDTAAIVTILCANLGILLNLTKESSINKAKIEDLEKVVGDVKTMVFRSIYKQ